MITHPLSLTIAPFKIAAITKMFIATHDHLQGIPEEKKGTKSKIVTKTAVVEELAQQQPSGHDCACSVNCCFSNLQKEMHPMIIDGEKMN